MPAFLDMLNFLYLTPASPYKIRHSIVIAEKSIMFKALYVHTGVFSDIVWV